MDAIHNSTYLNRTYLQVVCVYVCMCVVLTYAHMVHGQIHILWGLVHPTQLSLSPPIWRDSTISPVCVRMTHEVIHCTLCVHSMTVMCFSLSFSRHYFSFVPLILLIFYAQSIHVNVIFWQFHFVRCTDNVTFFSADDKYYSNWSGYGAHSQKNKVIFNWQKQ